MFEMARRIRLTLLAWTVILVPALALQAGCTRHQRCYRARMDYGCHQSHRSVRCPRTYHHRAGGEPQSWVRIEGDVYTQSYLESLYAFENDY